MQEFHVPFYVPWHTDKPKIEIVNIVADKYAIKPNDIAQHYRKLANIEDVQQYVNDMREKQLEAEREAKQAKNKLNAMERALENFIAHVQYKYCPAHSNKEAIEIQESFHRTFNWILKQYEKCN